MSSDKANRRWNYRTRLLDIAWLLLLCVYVLAGTVSVPFHADEATQIFISTDYALPVAEVVYQEAHPRPDLQYLRLINGSIARYTAGLAWDMAGFSLGDVNEQWDWAADWEYNVSTGHMPSAGMLHASRAASALMTAASVVVLYALGRLLDGRFVAYLATGFYALHPAILLNGRRAMMEGSMLLFALLALLCALVLLRRHTWGWAVAFGAAAGLALAAKHTNVFGVGAIFAALVFFPLVVRLTGREDASARTRLWQTIVAGLVALVFFYALNPVWWGADPFDISKLILRFRSDLLASQAATYDSYSGLVDQLAGLGRQALFGWPQYYEDSRFAGWIASEIAAYEVSPWRGVSIGGTVVGAVALLALALLGGWRFVCNRRFEVGERWLVGVWALAVAGTTCLLTPLEWQRYYLPVLPVIGLFAAMGFVQVTQLVRHRLQAS